MYRRCAIEPNRDAYAQVFDVPVAPVRDAVTQVGDGSVEVITRAVGSCAVLLVFDW
jgi:hypothetical protein